MPRDARKQSHYSDGDGEMKTRSGSATGIAAIIAGCFVISSLDSVAQAPPVAKIMAGTLTCQGKGSVGLIVGSKQRLDCSFKPAGNGAAQSYTATITNVGLDVGVKGANTMVWTVLFSSTSVPKGALAGKYTGIAADVSLGLGGGAKVLIGGSKQSVELQPLSVQGQAGVNLAIGVSGLTLSQVR